MDSVTGVDVALLPVSGVYVMTAQEAAEAARRIQPRVAVPMHWGEHLGTEEDARMFADKASVEVRIMEKAAVSIEADRQRAALHADRGGRPGACRTARPDERSPLQRRRSPGRSTYGSRSRARQLSGVGVGRRARVDEGRTPDDSDFRLQTDASTLRRAGHRHGRPAGSHDARPPAHPRQAPPSPEAQANVLRRPVDGRRRRVGRHARPRHPLPQSSVSHRPGLDAGTRFHGLLRGDRRRSLVRERSRRRAARGHPRAAGRPKRGRHGHRLASTPTSAWPRDR